MHRATVFARAEQVTKSEHETTTHQGGDTGAERPPTAQVIVEVERGNGRRW
jgi:hypothetical protein